MQLTNSTFIFLKDEILSVPIIRKDPELKKIKYNFFPYNKGESITTTEEHPDASEYIYIDQDDDGDILVEKATLDFMMAMGDIKRIMEDGNVEFVREDT